MHDKDKRSKSLAIYDGFSVIYSISRRKVEREWEEAESEKLKNAILILPLWLVSLARFSATCNYVITQLSLQASSSADKLMREKPKGPPMSRRESNFPSRLKGNFHLALCQLSGSL